MSFRLLIEKRATKEITSLPPDVQQRIISKIRSILAENPFPGGRGDIKRIEASEFWRLRVGHYRVFYSVDTDVRTIFILSVVHRSKAYREV